MKMQYDGYNEKLNKIYFNPYANSHSNNKGRTSSPSIHSLGTPAQQYGLSVNSITSAHGIQESGSTDGSGLGRSPRNGDGRINRGFRLSASQIFSKEIDNHVKVQEQKKPTINYFVTEFQRLQAENKALKTRLQQQQGKFISAGTTGTQLVNSNSDLLKAQNIQLRKQLQQQQKMNEKKNEQIGQLVNKITEIQNQIAAITNSQNLQKQQEYNKKKAELQQLYTGKLAEVEQRKVQMEQQVNQRMKQVEREKVARFNESEARRMALEKEMEERVKVIQSQRINRLKQLQSMKTKWEQQTRLKIIQLQNDRDNKLREQQQRHQQQSQKIQEQFNTSLQYLRSHYSKQIIGEKCEDFVTKVAELQIKLQQALQKYKTLEQQLNNMRYVPKLK